MKRVKLAIAAACAAALGAIAATVWVGASVREETVVAHPYEDGLRQDADRLARAALGLEVTLPGVAEAGVGPIAFELRDRAGNPEDRAAAVTVEISRPDTSRGERAVAATPLGPGRWSADLAFPAPGPWDVRFDVLAIGDRVRLERRVVVRPACDLAARACARPIDGGGEVVLELLPRPLRAMAELSVRVSIREPPPAGPLPRSAGEAGHPAASTPTAISGATSAGATSPTVTVSFSMPGMTMGENRSTLSPAGPGAYEGRAVLVRCATGRRGWIAEVELAAPGAAPRTARFPLTLPEDGR